MTKQKIWTIFILNYASSYRSLICAQIYQCPVEQIKSINFDRMKIFNQCIMYSRTDPFHFYAINCQRNNKIDTLVFFALSSWWHKKTSPIKFYYHYSIFFVFRFALLTYISNSIFFGSQKNTDCMTC